LKKLHYKYELLLVKINSKCKNVME
jgi:hypothetical protein